MIFGNLDPNKATMLAGIDVPSKKQPLHLVRAGNTRAIIVHGAHLLSEKLLALVGAVLDMTDEGVVSSLTFRDDCYPHEVNAVADHDTKGIAVNLSHLFEDIWGTAEEKDAGLNVLAMWYLYVLTAIGHEVAHLEKCARMGREQYFNIDPEQREDDCDVYATQVMISLAQRFNIEPTSLKDEPYLAGRMSQIFITRPDAPMTVKQRQIIEIGAMYFKDGVQIKKLREYVRGFDDDTNAPLWRMDTFDITITYHKGAEGTEAQFKPVPEGVVAPAAVPMAAVVANAGAVAIPVNHDGEAGEVYVDDMLPPSEGGVIYYDGAQGGEDGAIYSDDTQDDGVEQSAVQAAPMPYSSAAAVQQPTFQPKPPRTFTPNNYTDAQLVQFGMAVYKRCQDVFWAKCGWTGNGYFTAPQAVMDPVRIDDIVPPDFVVACEGYDANGKWNFNKPAGAYITGFVAKNAKVPSFKLHINCRGNGIVRLIVAQNPDKVNGFGGLSKTAHEARCGNRIAWIIKDGDGKWFGSFTNDVFKPAS